MKENFNILITGVGGQGLVTLVDVMTKAIFADGKDVKSSELHGLSQRGGAVAVYVAMGKKVYSPLFKKGDCDLILGMELLEALRGLQYANKGTKVLANNKFLPLAVDDGNFTKEKVLADLQKIVGNPFDSAQGEFANSNLYLVDASKICQDKLQIEVLATMYMLGFAVYNELLDIKPESVLVGIKKAIPEKYLDINKQAFMLAKI